MPSTVLSPLERRPVEMHPIDSETRPPRSFTANELIAMARAARARRLDP
ncbi:hypothetical protein [Methylorubrum aminovorans]|nr:hypothetical protein [Methylorubrum aminovorans]